MSRLGGVSGIAVAMREMARRVEETTPSERARRVVSLATVISAKEPDISVRMPGFPDPVPAVSSDLFDLFPLSNGDVVVVAPMPGGRYVVIARVGGTAPEVSVGPEGVNAALVTAGAPLDDGQGDGTTTLIQWYRSPAAISFATGIASDFTWTFDQPFGSTPFVLAQTVSADANRTDLFVAVKSVTSHAAVFTARNYNAAAVLGKLTAMAHGIVE